MNTAEAITTGLTGQHIATNLANYEAARSPFFVFEIDDFSNLLKPNVENGIDDATETDYYNNDRAREAIRLNVTQCSIPHYTVATQEFRRGNDVVKFAGLPTYSAGSFTVDDLVGLDTKSILMSWLRLAYDPHTHKGGRMKDYKKTGTLFEYTQDYELIRTWKIYGCFVTGIQEDNFNKESDGKRQLTATLEYDRAVMIVNE